MSASIGGRLKGAERDENEIYGCLQSQLGASVTADNGGSFGSDLVLLGSWRLGINWSSDPPGDLCRGLRFGTLDDA